MRRLFGSVGALLLSASPLQAAPNEQKEIQEFYRRGLAGEKEAVEQCIAKLEAVLKGQPANQLARVYLGSTYTLRSRDLGFGPKKLQALKHGLAVMDEAVAAAPDDPKVRLARALTTSSLPGIFGRAASSRSDFDRLAQMAEATPGRFEEGDLQIVYYQAGRSAKAAGNQARAVILWQEALRHPVDPVITTRVNAELAKL